jgi:chromosome segregation ATPase
VSARLEDEIDRLYAAPLDEFVSERKALSRKLKQAGAADAASEVAGLRKPTVAAWTVNQLARTHRRDVDLLLDAGKRIVDAQQASISEGGRAGIDAARMTLRKAVTDLTASAQGILGERASQSTLTRVAETLRSAATEEKGRELLARGRLTAELSDTGWDTIAALVPGDSRERTKPTATKHRERQAGVKAAREAVRQEQSALAAATTRLQKTVQQEERLRDQLRAATTAVTDAEAAIAGIEKRLKHAQQQLRELTGR